MHDAKEKRQEKRKYAAARKMRGNTCENDVSDRARRIFNTKAFTGEFVEKKKLELSVDDIEKAIRAANKNEVK